MRKVLKSQGRRSASRIPDCFQRYRTVETSVQILQHTLAIRRVADFASLLDGVSATVFTEDERLPYWADLWPSAVALAQVITQRFDLGGKQVLELGCGLGLVGIVAALRGGKVLSTDYEADSLAFARHNATLNRCTGMEFRLVDWRAPRLKRRYDFIFASDIIYERRSFGPLVALLKRFLSRGGVALFSEPRRAAAEPFFELLDRRGFIRHRELVPLHFEGNHLIAVHTIAHPVVKGVFQLTSGAHIS